MTWWRRLIRRAALDRQLDAEVADHLHRQMTAGVQAGLSEDEARRQALLAFGGQEAVKEACRDVRGTRWIEDGVSDARYALRHLRRHPVFALIAALSLGLGIGATAAIFCLVDAVLLKTLPARAPHELVLLGERTGTRHVLSWSVDQLRSLRQSEALTGLCAFRPRVDFSITRAGDAELAAGQLLSGNCFDLLGLRAELGRLLTADDERAGDARPAAVISHDFWRRQFAGDPGVIGRSLDVKGHPVTIVGVAPPEFYGFEPGRAVDVSVPLSLQSWVLPPSITTSSRVRWLRLIGRRRPDVSNVRAEADLARLSAPPRPGAEVSHFVLLDGAQGLNDLREQFSLPLQLLMAAVAVLLLIACANLASLMLARTRAREHEVTLRLVLGAGRGRVIRQLMTESLVLSAIGGVAGLIVAYWGSHAIVALLSRGRAPILLDLGVDLRLLGFTVAVSLLTSLCFGVWPAVAATRADLQPRLQAAARTVAGSNRLRSHALIVAQTVLSLVLVIAAVLFARSLTKLYGVDTRLDKQQVLLVGIRAGISKQEGPRAAQIFQDLSDRLSAVPGVRSVTQSMDIPFGGSPSYRADVSTPGPTPRSDDQATFNFVAPRFFETMGIPLIAGRDFRADDAQGRPVAVISESLARHYFAGRTVVGEHLQAGDTLVEVIGVSRDIPYEGVRAEKEFVLYRLLSQAGQGIAAGTFAIRADLPVAVLGDLVRRTLHDVAPTVPIVSATTLEAQFDSSIATERLLANIAAFFGAMALLLVAIGVYGTLTSSVAQRNRELGIRLALGATRGEIARMTLVGALTPVALGLAVGLPIAFLGVRVAEVVLFGVTPRDPLTYVTGVFGLLVVSAAAAALPARAAARADPIASLRQD